MSKIYKSLTDLIGNTPLLELSNYEKENNLEAKILVKLEYFNPAGSVKDRIAKKILDDAEAKGLINKAYKRQHRNRSQRCCGGKRL